MASLQKNVSNQNVTFCMIVASTGAADTSATVSVKVTKDNGSQNSGLGSVTNKGNGQYSYAIDVTESNALNVGFLFTASGDVPVNIDFHTDPTNFQLLAIDSNGNAAVSSNVKRNTAWNAMMFPMTDSTNHALKTGASFTSGGAQRSLDGAAFANCVNLPVEIANGFYFINLPAADTNASRVQFLFTASGCDPTAFEVITQP